MFLLDGGAFFFLRHLGSGASERDPSKSVQWNWLLLLCSTAIRRLVPLFFFGFVLFGSRRRCREILALIHTTWFGRDSLLASFDVFLSLNLYRFLFVLLVSFVTFRVHSSYRGFLCPTFVGLKKNYIYIYIYVVLRIKSRTGFVERNSCWPNYLILFSFFLVIFVDWGLAGWPS